MTLKIKLKIEEGKTIKNTYVDIVNYIVHFY